MKKVGAALLLSAWTLGSLAQSGSSSNKLDNTLLWKISGNGLASPSYLFGTIHMLCAEDAQLSASFRKIIKDAEEVYFEVDLDNITEMFGVLSKMRMRGDTTLKDLLDEEKYKVVREFFESKGGTIPFSMIETYKPILALSTVQENSLKCESMTMMEQEIMLLAKENKKKIRGLESMAYQAGVLDSIPYKLQAEQLVSYIENINKNEREDRELDELMQAYRDQDITRLEELMMRNDLGIGNFTDILLYNRNRNWVEKLKTLLPEKSLLIAVGAGHLPGEMGMILLLRKAGYTVTPVENKQASHREI